jgi:hypothetical protein
MVTLMNLQDAGILRVKDKKAPGYFDWNFDKISETFRLIKDDFNIEQPQDISYIYNGYASLSVKLVESIIQSGGLSKVDGLKLIGLNDENTKTNHE